MLGTLHRLPHPMKTHVRPRIVMLAQLEDHSAREACLGAAQYAAEAQLAFEPWSLSAGQSFQAEDFGRVDGLLISYSVSQKVLRASSTIKVPHLFFLGSSPQPKSPGVALDERAIGRMAVEHFLHRGYPNLACVSASSRDWVRERVEGFTDECRRRGLKVRHHEFSEEVLPVYWRKNSLQENEEVLRVLRDLPKPVGIFAINDVAACLLIETARAEGIRVPDELGVLGVDNDLIPNSAAGLSLSSIEPPFRSLGFTAAKLLHAMLQGETVPKETLLPPVRVLVRTSTDAFMVGHPLIQRAQAYIEQHRQTQLRVSAVARASGATTVTLGKYFQQHLNVSPSEYILRRRIDYAKELLHDGMMNVEEVSARCGFHSCSYFCLVFRRVAGITPGSLRPRN